MGVLPSVKEAEASEVDAVVEEWEILRRRADGLICCAVLVEDV